jgi:hypothetical protein
VLLGLRTDSAIIDDGSAGNGVFPVVDKDGRVYEIAICIIVAHPEFCDLAGRPTVRILMAVDAGSCVVYGSKAIRNGFVFLIDLLIPSKGVSGWFNESIVDACSTVKTGRVKSGRRFSR